MPHRQLLQKRAGELLNELDLKAGFTAYEFMDKLEQKKGLRITAASLEMPPGHTGLIARSDEGYVLLFKQNTSWLHQQHIIFHECAHIILGHKTSKLNEYFNRADLDEDLEREAEYFATAIMERALKGALKTKGRPADEKRDNYDIIPSELIESANKLFNNYPA